MSEKIKSWVGCNVRIKREYLNYQNCSYPEGEITEVSVKDDCPLRHFFGYHDMNEEYGRDINPHYWVGRVQAHIYGVNLLPSSSGRDIDWIEMSHKIVIEGLPDNNWAYVWETEYFEVVKETSVTTTKWVADEKFTNQ